MSADEEVDVSIRFFVDPFEICISSKAKRSSLVDLLVGLFSTIKDSQNTLAEATAGVDLKKIRPIGKAIKPAVEDPLEKVAEKLMVPPEKLREVLRVENNMPIIIANEKFASPEKGAMVLIYAFQFGLDRKPTHKQISASFKQSGFEPAFGKRSKGALKRAGKIDEQDDVISLTGSGISDAEAEVKRITESVPK